MGSLLPEVSNPYLHLTPKQYGAAERNGLHVCRIHTEPKAWDFKVSLWILGFWLGDLRRIDRFIAEAESFDFVTDVLDRYRIVATDEPGEEIPSSFIRWISRSRPPKAM
jgi:trans-aconitate 2-methyltransferase